MQQCSNTNITHNVFVLVITCLKGRFEINYMSAFVKILKLPKLNEGNLKIFKSHKRDLSQKLPEPKCGYWLITTSQ